jgi:hypothetical protein
MCRFLFAFCLVAALVTGCAQERTSGTVLEATQLARGETITVLWQVGAFNDPFVHQTMVRDGTYGKDYESCTSLLIARTFANNGYRTQVRRMAIGEKPLESLPRNARYVLLILNKGARMNKLRTPAVGRAGPSEGFGAIVFEMQLELLDRGAGKRLWSGSEAFFTDAKSNAPSVVRIVKGLAADGYLDIKPESVLDALGTRVGPEVGAPPNCPV